MLSCSNGDIDIPAFDFEDTVSVCGEYVLYRTNDDDTEAIVLTLSDDDFTTEVGEKTFPISSTREIVYRIFNDGISSSYFCQNIPPVTPTVIKELTAESGTIVITTTLGIDGDEDAGYTYTIEVQNLVFNDDGDTITFETFNFGELEATIN